MGISKAGILSVFFAACFLALQLGQFNQTDPKENSYHSYLVAESIIAPSFVTLTGQVGYNRWSPKLSIVSIFQNNLSLKLYQYQQVMFRFVSLLFDEPRLQQLQVIITAAACENLYQVQQKVRRFVEPATIIYNLFQPTPKSSRNYFSL
ncbi:hypothetical protein [Paraglaciecola sp. 2405UD69-4]|uniref:hypothetical protein n=1 Tax=Paraglaciecola sp. 2405UD69-4 TaxID=3391836 RepID=UPI0039C9A84E